MALVLVLAVLGWWLLSDERPASTTSTAPPAGPSCSSADGMIGCQVGPGDRYTVGGGQLGPGEAIPPPRAIVTTYRRGPDVPPPPPPPGKPAKTGGLTLW